MFALGRKNIWQILVLGAKQIARSALPCGVFQPDSTESAPGFYPACPPTTAFCWSNRLLLPEFRLNYFRRVFSRILVKEPKHGEQPPHISMEQCCSSDCSSQMQSYNSARFFDTGLYQSRSFSTPMTTSSF